MSWSAHIIHTETGLALTFAEPVTRLELAPDVAAHLASLLAVEARHRLSGVVRTLTAENIRNSQPRHRGAPVHPLCCDCDRCLNGEPRG